MRDRRAVAMVAQRYRAPPWQNYLREGAFERRESLVYLAVLSLFAMRPTERRDAWAAFLTLFGLVGSHAILETARDALFLARVAATKLPWVFLSIAGVSLVALRAQGHIARHLRGRRALAVWTFVAAFGTYAFYAAFDELGQAGLYLLYIWSGVLATTVLTQFWMLMGNLFSVTQAKRLYGFIGAGSVLGAIAGTFVASVLPRFAPPQTLLFVAATGFASTAFVPLALRGAGNAPAATERPQAFFENLSHLSQ